MLTSINRCLSRLLLPVGLLVVASSAAQESADVRVGVVQSVSDAGMYVALEKGYFTEQKINVDLRRVGTAASVITELASGNLDVSGGSPGAGVYNAVRQGLAFRIVADKGSTLPGHGYFAFVVRKDLSAQIKTASDLRGRVLAATGYNAGSSNVVTIHRLLAGTGVKTSDVNIIDMPFSDIWAGLGTGRFDVGMLIEPLVTQAVDKGIGVVWKRTDEIYPNQQYGAVLYGPGIIKRPSVANRFMIGYLKGVRFYNDALNGRAPREELVSILTKHTNVKNPELYQKMVFPGLDPNGTLNTKGMKDDIQVWVSSGHMKEAVDVNKVVDMSYAENAVQKLGGRK